VCVAELRNFRLAFTRFSPKRDGGVADIVPAEGHSVWGVVFDLADADLIELDRFEGALAAAPAYRRREVTVQTTDEEQIAALTYEVVSKALVDVRPTSEYHSLLVRGAEHWGLPAEYCEKLKKIEVK
jgi:cation transport regulator ChaC